MLTNFQNVYQFKISLDESTPPVWRRIQVPDTYTFWDLHIAIQNAMGWANSHFSFFEIMNPKTSSKDCIKGFKGGPGNEDALVSWKVPLNLYFSNDIKRAHYRYDFGDSWEHTVLCEKILPREEGVSYPICIAGKSACPPEDCGGIGGYRHLVQIIKNPQHPHHKDLMEWVGLPFDPDAFQAENVTFLDPQKCLEIALKL